MTKKEEMMDKIIYITTPIYYVNDVPHIGHAYTTIAADVLARYYRAHGMNVHFLTGTDEHGQKIEDSAKKKGVDPKTFTDEIAQAFKELWNALNISNNDFIRTTDDKHVRTVQEIFKKLYDKEDIYKGEYEGWYCVHCETYYPETDLNEGKECPDCKRPLSQVKEDAYFFNLSKYEDKLLKYYEDNPEFMMPVFRGNEMKNFIKNGLKDLCVTRKKVKWAIPVPFDEEHTVYVWFDALINYISAINFIGDKNAEKKFENYWPCDIHFIGKEIFKFHTIIWPAMLFALGLEPPKKVFGHGWWTVEGNKMSKSVGNVVDPRDVIKEYNGNEDVLRYFVLREVPFGSDGDFSHTGLEQRYNSELANDLGNLFSRVLNMIGKYADGIVPDKSISGGALITKAQESGERYETSMGKADFYKALIYIWELISEANKYVEDRAPWKLAKNEVSREELKQVLFDLAAVLALVARFLFPFMPKTAKKMWSQLGLQCLEKEINIAVKAGEKPIIDWKQIMKNRKIGNIESLFPRKEKNDN
ncbi:MAG: methionine--tRNA ligase [Elusimicrobiota bacterium]